MTNINPALTALIDPADLWLVPEALAVLELDPVAPDPAVVVAAEPEEPVAAGKLPEPVTPKSANVPFLHSLRKSWSSCALSAL
jgi:hypothetical protein